MVCGRGSGLQFFHVSPVSFSNPHSPAPHTAVSAPPPPSPSSLGRHGYPPCHFHGACTAHGGQSDAHQGACVSMRGATAAVRAHTRARADDQRLVTRPNTGALPRHWVPQWRHCGRACAALLPAVSAAFRSAPGLPPVPPECARVTPPASWMRPRPRPADPTDMRAPPLPVRSMYGRGPALPFPTTGDCQRLRRHRQRLQPPAGPVCQCNHGATG